ncbi:MAG TPA: OmpA family protein [Candidatus Polarisedimenticolia bacterium]|nr:OmpA family protein [Candidatus Polarisedimenticolia bacterium]
MTTRSRTIVAGLAALAVAGSWGCVTKRRFQETTAATDTRITGVEGSVEANERRIEDLRKETDGKIGEVGQQAGKAQQTGNQALSKAEEAAQMAKGKILWSVSLTDDQVKFGRDKSVLPAEATAMLDDLAAKVKAYGKAVYVEIEGHTDSTGPEAYNIVLGERRAMAARNYLSQKGGIPLHAMSTISYGESQPVADNSTAAGRAQNRRVVIRVLE